MYFIFAFIGFNLVFNVVEFDGYRHAKEYEKFVPKDYQDFKDELAVIASRDTDKVDYYVTVVNFFASRISSNYGFALIIHSLIFSFFFLKTLNLVYNEFGASNNNQRLFLLGIIFIMPLWQLNALRYPIALWIWSFGAIHYLCLKQWKFLMFLPLASLVHFGITPATVIFLMYMLLGERTQIYFYAFIATLIISETISFTFIQELMQGLGTGIERRAEGYLSEGYIEMRHEGLSAANWYVAGRIKWFNNFVLFSLIFIYLKRRKIFMDELAKVLFAFSLFYATYINLIIDVPSLGGRQRWFLWISVMILLYRLVSLNLRSNFTKYSFYIGLFPILLYSIIEFRTGWYYLSLDVLIGNPILSLFFQSGISINEIFRG